MTRDDINRIYIQVSDELCDGKEWCWSGVGEPLQRFAELVAAAEREACLEACRMYVDLNEPPDGFQNGVECCIAVITHKDDPDVMARIKARGKE